MPATLLEMLPPHWHVIASNDFIYKPHLHLREAVSGAKFAHSPASYYNQMECLCSMFLVCKLPRQCPIHLCIFRTQCWTQRNVLYASQTSTANKVKTTSSIGQQERSVQVNIWQEF